MLGGGQQPTEVAGIESGSCVVEHEVRGYSQKVFKEPQEFSKIPGKGLDILPI